jgi:hypothetical protein
VTREDLPAAVQAVQSAHAAVEYAARYPAVAGCTLVMLTVPGEEALRHHSAILGLHGIDVIQFREPDLGNELTAIAVSHPGALRRLAKLPLLLREGVM